MPITKIIDRVQTSTTTGKQVHVYIEYYGEPWKHPWTCWVKEIDEKRTKA